MHVAVLTGLIYLLAKARLFGKVTGIDRVRIVPVLVQRSHGKKHGKVWQSDGVPSLQEIIMQNF